MKRSNRLWENAAWLRWPVMAGVLALSSTAESLVPEPDGTLVPKLNAGEAVEEFSPGSLTLAGLFEARGEPIDWQNDAQTRPAVFSPLCEFTGTLVLRGGGCKLDFGWYNAEEGVAAPQIYTLVPRTDPIFSDAFRPQAGMTGNTFTARDIRSSANYKGGLIGFALRGDPGEYCTETKYSEQQLNTVCTACTPQAPWITALIYESKLTPNAFYVAFEDLPTSPDQFDPPKDGPWGVYRNDGDFNDFVYFITGVTCDGAGEPCDTGLKGACTLGRTGCAAAGAAQKCIPELLPTAESCDNIDNDCNEIVDDGNLCPNGFVCQNGTCVQACGGGEFRCAADLVCDDGFCVDPLCKDKQCGAGEVCRSGECTGSCNDVVCPKNELCQLGRCVDPCANVACGDGQVCEGGICAPRCECRASCPAGNVCHAVSGKCVTPECARITCESGTVCEKGSCVDACSGAVCPAGAACIGGHCVEQASSGGAGPVLFDEGITISGGTGGGLSTRGTGGTGAETGRAQAENLGCACRASRQDSDGLSAAWWVAGWLVCWRRRRGRSRAAEVRKRTRWLLVLSVLIGGVACAAGGQDDANPTPAAGGQSGAGGAEGSAAATASDGTGAAASSETGGSLGASGNDGLGVGATELPAQPVGLSISNGPDHIELTWIDAADDEAGYRIYWSAENQKPAVPNQQLDHNTTSTIVPGSELVPYQLYYLWVEPYNSFGAGPSATGTGVTGELPSAPEALGAEVDGVSVRLSWSDTSSNEDGFDVFWSNSASKPAVPNASVGADATSYAVEGLDPSTSYHFWVVAKNLLGSSAAATTAATTAAVPAAPLDFRAIIVDDTTLNVSFVDNADNEDGYRVYWAKAASKPAQPQVALTQGSGTGSVLSTIVNDLTPHTLYYFWIEGINAAGAGPALTGRAAAGHVPATPTNLQMDLTTSRFSIAVTWNDNSDNESGFDIYWSTTDVKPTTPGASVPAGATGYVLSQILGGQTYRFWVEAANPVGVSDAVKAIASQATTDLSWRELYADSADWIHLAIHDTFGLLSDGNSSTQLYAYHSADPNQRGPAFAINDWILYNPATANIDIRRTHYFWGEARTPSGSLFSLRQLEPGPALGELSANASETEVVLGWQAALGAASYRVQLSTTNSLSAALLAGTTSGSTYTLRGLDPGTAHFFWVTALGSGIGGSGLPGIPSTIGATTAGTPIGDNLAVGKTAVASSENSGLSALNATDENVGSRWQSNASDPQWIYVDLGAELRVSHVRLVWEAAYSHDFEIQLCAASCAASGGDANAWPWRSVHSGSRDLTAFPNYELIPLVTSAVGRFVRVVGLARTHPWGHSLYELEVYSAA